MNDYLIELWGVQKEEEEKLKHMLINFADLKKINAEIIQEHGIYVYFRSFLEIPGKKQKILQLLGISLIFIILLLTLIFVVSFV